MKTPRRRRTPKVLSRVASLVFYPDTGTFNETVEVETLRPDDTVTFAKSINPKPAGALEGSTLYVYMNGARRNAAKIAWYFHYGENLPTRTRIKHLDGDVWNNRKENLSIERNERHPAITRIAGAVVSLGRYATRAEADAAVSAARAAVGMGPVKSRGGVR